MQPRENERPDAFHGGCQALLGGPRNRRRRTVVRVDGTVAGRSVSARRALSSARNEGLRTERPQAPDIQAVRLPDGRNRGNPIALSLIAKRSHRRHRKDASRARAGGASDHETETVRANTPESALVPRRSRSSVRWPCRRTATALACDLPGLSIISIEMTYYRLVLGYSRHESCSALWGPAARTRSRERGSGRPARTPVGSQRHPRADQRCRPDGAGRSRAVGVDFVEPAGLECRCRTGSWPQSQARGAGQQPGVHQPGAAPNSTPSAMAARMSPTPRKPMRRVCTT